MPLITTTSGLVGAGWRLAARRLQSADWLAAAVPLLIALWLQASRLSGAAGGSLCCLRCCLNCSLLGCHSLCSRRGSRVHCNWLLCYRGCEGGRWRACWNRRCWCCIAGAYEKNDNQVNGQITRQRDTQRRSQGAHRRMTSFLPACLRRFWCYKSEHSKSYSSMMKSPPKCREFSGSIAYS